MIGFSGIIVEGFDQNNQRFQITLPADGNVSDADIQEAARILMADLNNSATNKPQMVCTPGLPIYEWLFVVIWPWYWPDGSHNGPRPSVIMAAQRSIPRPYH